MKERLKFATLAGLSAGLLVAMPAAANAVFLGNLSISDNAAGIVVNGTNTPPPTLAWTFMAGAHVNGTDTYSSIIADSGSLGTIDLTLGSIPINTSTEVLANYMFDSGQKLDLGSLQVGAVTHEVYADFDSGLSGQYEWLQQTVHGHVLTTISLSFSPVTGKIYWGTQEVDTFVGSLNGSHSGNSQTSSGTLTTTAVPEPFTMVLGGAAFLLGIGRRRRRR